MIFLYLHIGVRIEHSMIVLQLGLFDSQVTLFDGTAVTAVGNLVNYLEVGFVEQVELGTRQETQTDVHRCIVHDQHHPLLSIFLPQGLQYLHHH